jgi:Family of unknown function (DUF5895)
METLSCRIELGSSESGTKSLKPSTSLKIGAFLVSLFNYFGELPMTNKYLAADYAATEISFGYVQALRGEVDPSHCGYFVSLSQMEKSGWRNIDPSQLTTYTFNSGTTEVGMLLKQPRMVLTPISQLGMFDRTASAKTESLVVVGNWNRDLKGNPDIGNFQVYLVVFLDEQNQQLHDIPLKLTAKGSHQASLAEQWQKSCTAVALAHSKAMGVPFRPRNEIYNALCVFVPVITRKLVGESKKSPACYIDGFDKPTTDNWQKFFLGNQEDIADAVVGMMNPQPRTRLVSAQSFALTPHVEPEAVDPKALPAAPATYPKTRATFPSGEEIDVQSSIVPSVEDGDDRIPF